MRVRTLIAAFMALAPAPAAAADDALLGPMAGALRARVGRWCVEARLQLTPQARPVTIHAVAESRLVGGRWLLTQMRGPGFDGVGLNGFDPATGRYHGYWADGTRGFAVPVEGDYDRAQEVFRTLSTERRANGESIVVRSETRPNGPDGEVTVFTAPDAAGRPYERMRLTGRRAREGTDCPANPPMAR